MHIQYFSNIPSVPCSAYVLRLKDVVNHLFGEQMFAKFAGVRTRAMLDSPFFERLDQAHGGALSMLSSRDEVQNTSARESDAVQGDDAGAGSSLGATACDTDASDCEAVDPDPTDEVMTGGGDSLTLLCALFIDGVQLHDHGRATTTVVGLKFLDLPGFLCNTDVACFPLAYIGGSKEPTCLTEITALILEQFKNHEVSAVKGIDGDASHRLVIRSVCVFF